MKELTLTRALVELKLYDSKITKAINDLSPVSYSLNNIVIEHRKTKEEFVSDYKSSIQKISDLRNNKTILKNALMKANAETKVNILEKEYTILEAINRKNDINVEKAIVKKLKSSLNEAQAKTNQIKDNVEADIERTINSKSGSSGNQSKDYVETIRNSYNSRMPELINDKDVEKLIIEKEEEIDNFLAEVDFVLSETNALTKIKVELK
jgi:hypothetical protein